MTIAFRGSAATNFAATGSTTGAVSGQAVGDLLFARGITSSGAFTAISGWNQVSLQQDGNTGFYEYFAWKVAASTSEGFNPSFSGGGSANLMMSAWSGTTPAYDTSNHTDASGTTTFTPGSVTPSADNDMYVLCTQDTSGSGATPTLPSGFTDTAADMGNASGALFYKLLSGQNGTPQNQAITYSAASYGPAVAILIKEGGGGGGGGGGAVIIGLMD